MSDMLNIATCENICFIEKHFGRKSIGKDVLLQPTLG